MKNLWIESLFYLAIILFVGSLFLPGLVTQPRSQFNPGGDTLCDSSGNGNGICYRNPRSQNIVDGCMLTNDISVVQKTVPGATIVSQQEMQRYCAGKQSGTIEVPNTYPGWFILVFGVFGYYGKLSLGILAWYANIAALVVLITVKARARKTALVSAIFAVVLGLFALALTYVPADEAGNIIAVDHLALGYYLWELALVFLAVYCVLKFTQSRKAGM